MYKNNHYKEKIKMKIAMYNAAEEISDKYFQKNNKKRRNVFMKKKVIATACASFILVSSIAFATNIVNNKKQNRGLGEGIDTAIENGYIAEPNIKFINNEDIGTDITVENFIMDDTNLSAKLIFDFGETLNGIINLDKVYEVELKDLIIRDEENRILYGGNDKESFKVYCEENKLNYNFEEFNENYLNSGVDCFIESKENNNITLMYNMYSENFPKSKKLYFSFTQLSISEDKGEKFIINGDWQVKVDVPEKMYNREEEYYKVISCDNDDFKIYLAKLTDTGFEFGVIISNIEKPISNPEKLERAANAQSDYINGIISEEEYTELRQYFLDNFYLKNPISTSDYNYNGKQLEVSYVENEKEEKFEPTLSPGRRANYEFLEGNKYNFCETFGMTKYDATNKIRVVLYYYESVVTIELEKINN